jgi:DNA-binding response OmpR family regulator
MRCFLVEDHVDIAENIAEFLEAEGHEVSMVMDGVSALAVLRGGADAFDVVIMDVMLPRMDGVSVVRELRAAGMQRPVLFLTARDTLDDKLAGFEAGGDDYLVKPFHLPELQARLEALCRRPTPGLSEPTADPVMQVDELSIDVAEHRVERAGQVIRINPTCFKLLQALAEASPRPVSHEDLESCVWTAGAPDSGALRTSIYLLRKAIDRPFGYPLLQTVHGIGYRLGPEHG